MGVSFSRLSHDAGKPQRTWPHVGANRRRHFDGDGLVVRGDEVDGLTAQPFGSLRIGGMEQGQLAKRAEVANVVYEVV